MASLIFDKCDSTNPRGVKRSGRNVATYFALCRVFYADTEKCVLVSGIIVQVARSKFVEKVGTCMPGDMVIPHCE